MRAVSLVAAAAALMSPLVAADWYLYYSQATNPVDQSITDQFHFFAGPPNCDEVINSQTYTPRDDVSGDKTGIRCDGCNVGGEINPTEVEFNEDFGHFTWYANRGDGDLVDLDDTVVGQCNVDTSDGFDCTDTTGTKYTGYSHLFCVTAIAAL